MMERVYLSMKKSLNFSLLFLLLSLIFTSCASLSAKRETSGGERSSSASEGDFELSSLAEAFVNDCFNSTIVRNFHSSDSDLPLLFLDRIEENERPFFDTESFYSDLKAEIIKSGRMKIALSEKEADFILSASVSEEKTIDMILKSCESGAVLWQGSCSQLQKSAKK